MSDAPPKIRVNPIDGTATMSSGAWSHTVPLADLPGWREFHAKLAKRSGGKFAQFYDPWLPVFDAAIAKAKRIAAALEAA